MTTTPRTTPTLRSPGRWLPSMIATRATTSGSSSTLEEVGQPGAGLVAHLSPDTARRLVRALSSALREIGESP